jgi:hypothetical protein
MIESKPNGLQVSCQKTCCNGYDGVNILRWNLEVERFIVQQDIQREENTFVLGVVEDHMSP